MIVSWGPTELQLQRCLMGLSSSVTYKGFQTAQPGQAELGDYCTSEKLSILQRCNTTKMYSNTRFVHSNPILNQWQQNRELCLVFCCVLELHKVRDETFSPCSFRVGKTELCSMQTFDCKTNHNVWALMSPIFSYFDSSLLWNM